MSLSYHKAYPFKIVSSVFIELLVNPSPLPGSRTLSSPQKKLLTAEPPLPVPSSAQPW